MKGCLAPNDSSEALHEAGPLRVLLVDDHLAILKCIGLYLTRAGYEVRCADSLDKAAFLLASRRFSVVVTDLHLTGGTGSEGLELCRHVRESHPRTRVVLLTGAEVPDVEREAARLGLSAIIHKPCPLSRVASVLGELTRNRGQSRRAGRDGPGAVGAARPPSPSADRKAGSVQARGGA